MVKNYCIRVPILKFLKSNGALCLHVEASSLRLFKIPIIKGYNKRTLESSKKRESNNTRKECNCGIPGNCPMNGRCLK